MEHLSKSQIKLIRSLQQKKFRDELGLFVAEGDKCINELRKSFELYILANQQNATSTEIQQMSSLRTPQGSIAVFHQPTYHDVKYNPLAETLLLVLDDIQDPGNLGTIIRTADWFGVRDIVCSPNTADCFNPKVVQATMGALARVKLHYTDLTHWLTNLPANTPVYGTLLDGTNIYDTATAKQGIIIMGNEGKGISDSIRRFITHPIRIPSFPANAETSESLNVAVATAITLAEFRRR